jgi:lysozyme
MMIQNKALQEIKSSESLSLSPYRDIGGYATIGWGNRFYENGVQVTMSDSPLTAARADQLFNYHILQFSKKVKSLLTVSLNVNQFGSLVSLCYNIGVANFTGSTVLRLVNNNPNDPNIEKAFAMWNKVKGTVVKGLVLRRKREFLLYKSFAVSSFIIPLLLLFYTLFIISA